MAGRASNGESTIYKGADGRWHGCVSVGFTLDGKLVGQFGEAGRKPGQFGWVHALSCVAENEIWTGELLNWRVQKFTLHPERATRTSSR